MNSWSKNIWQTQTLSIWNINMRAKSNETCFHLWRVCQRMKLMHTHRRFLLLSPFLSLSIQVRFMFEVDCMMLYLYSVVYFGCTQHSHALFVVHHEIAVILWSLFLQRRWAEGLLISLFDWNVIIFNCFIMYVVLCEQIAEAIEMKCAVNPHLLHEWSISFEYKLHPDPLL